MTSVPTLLGDGIENPHNARVMLDAARMFAWDCAFRDRCGLGEAWPGDAPGVPLPTVALDAFRGRHTPVVVLETLPGARDLYGFRPPRDGAGLALVVGNERRGIAHDVEALADVAVQIPMVSRRLNCLNVAAASGVGMYYLGRGGGGSLQARANPERRRPELLFVGGRDHVELGSAIRSAGAFGWSRLFIEDRGRAWFGRDRVTRSEGRGAARRGRNPIRLIPTEGDRRFHSAEAVVVSTRWGASGTPLHRINLARGPSQLVVIADEGVGSLVDEDLDRFGAHVRRAQLDVPVPDAPSHFRVLASIVLAEVARQVGRRAPEADRGPRPPVYDHALRLLADTAGEVVHLGDLLEF